LPLVALLGVLAGAVPVRAQQPPAETPPNPTTICGLPIPPPAALPPDNSGPVVFQIVPCFEAQGNLPLIDPATYLYYIQLQSSRPSQGIWVPWTEESERTVIDDHRRLWATNFLDDLSIEAIDYRFSNGVIGKMVVYKMEERQRVKIVDFVGSKKLETSDIDTKLREANAQIRLDTFIDAALIRKVEGVVREMLKAKGFQYSNVTHAIEELATGPKLVHLTFNLDEGPKVKIRQIDFEGNKAVSDGTLKKRLKENKEQWFLSFISGRGTYQENKFEEDANRVLEYYRDHGYVTAQVGDPSIEVLNDSGDKKTRYIRLRVPVIEGNRYRIGDFKFAGNTVVPAEGLRPLFKIKSGDFYNQKEIRDGFQKARDAYGSRGYFEFTGYPEFNYRDRPSADAPQDAAQDQAPAVAAAAPAGPPIVDVTMQIQEGKRYTINRITFVGNTTTRDNVIRRELRLFENNVFDTEAMKYSVRRINQLGYFKPLEGPPQDVFIEKTPGEDAKVDLRFKLEEQNRNQVTFGAGVSQFEGFFGQLSFQTANFLGRGESLQLSLQSGSRFQQYSLAFTEPFLFDRNITGGVNVFKSQINYIGQFTQQSVGGSTTFGFPIGRGFTRMFMTYRYERTRVSEINAAFCQPEVLARNPFLRDSLLLGGAGCEGAATDVEQIDPLTGLPFVVPTVSGGGQRTISRVTPTIVYNSIDQPIFPTTGRRLQASVDLAGPGGDTRFIKPVLEGVFFFRQNARMTLGMRGMFEFIHGLRGEIPIFERLFLGGEYNIRGFDIRTIGPMDPETGLVLGGNKSLLFNVEEIFTIANPVRLILFFDAGQVQPGAERLLDGTTRPGSMFAFNDFKTSTGVEVRFFMPVLNVPFRLIFAHNPNRAGVLDNTLRPQKAFQFRFAVGTTF
jgi:outer membrane protein insertion porin family